MRGNIRTITVLALASLFAAFMAQAQEAKMNAKTRGGRGYFMAGANILDLNGLNTKLQGAGYPAFSDNLFSLGGGGHAIIDRFIIGGEAHGLITDDKDFAFANRNYKSSLEAGYGFFNVGYQMIKNGDFSLYPLLGIGGGALSMKIRERTSTSFDEILANPGRNATLTTRGLLVHVALGVDYLFVTRQDERKSRGIVVGLCAGYNFAPVKGDWYLDELEIAGGPEIALTGPYLRLMIGGGNNRSK